MRDMNKCIILKKDPSLNNSRGNNKKREERRGSQNTPSICTSKKPWQHQHQKLAAYNKAQNQKKKRAKSKITNKKRN